MELLRMDMTRALEKLLGVAAQPGTYKPEFKDVGELAWRNFACEVTLYTTTVRAQARQALTRIAPQAE
jgi:hypothetical protein